MLLYFKPTPTASDKLEYKKPPSKFLVKLAILVFKVHKNHQNAENFQEYESGY